MADPLNVEQATRVTRVTDTHFQGEIVPGWVQGRTAFGGLIAAMAVRASSPTANGRQLRSLLVNFVGPIAPGTVDIEITPNRKGRSLTHVGIRILQEGTVRTVLAAVFGDRRETGIHRVAETISLPNVEELNDLPFFEGVAPEFSRRVRFRWSATTFPFCGNEVAHVQGFINYQEPCSYGQWGVVTMADSWPPPVWCWAKAPSKGSTISWQLNFLRPFSTVEDNPWWFYDARATQSTEGYADFEGKIYNTSGELVAISRQLFAEFSQP